MYIFISYSSKNTEEATNICKKLEESGHNCFLAYRDIVGGSVYAEELVNAIEKSDVVLLLLSEGSNNSPHVLREVERSCSKNIPIVVYKLEDVVLTKSLEYFLMTHQWVTKEDGDERLIGVFNNLEKRRSEQKNDKSGEDKSLPGNSDKKNKLMTKTNESDDEDDTPDGHERNKKGRSKINKVLCFLIVLGVLLIAFIVVLSKNISEKRKINPDDKNNREEQDVSSSIIETVHNMQPGDCITIGSYRGKPIEWVALHKNEDGSIILISKDILCLKMFDAPESGEFGTCTDASLLNDEEPLDRTYWTDNKIEKYGAEALIEAYGNNDWSVSDLRCWLNADKNLVSYEEGTSGYNAQNEKAPSYSDEKGFLKNFTDEEKNALSEYTYTYENSITKEKTTLSDKVFLLSEQELEWFFEEDISPLAKVADGALEDDYEGMYANYNNNGYYYWWLRDGSKEAACMNRCAFNSMDEPVFEYLSSYYGYGGIRPCICIK